MNLIQRLPLLGLDPPPATLEDLGDDLGVVASLDSVLVVDRVGADHGFRYHIQPILVVQPLEELPEVDHEELQLRGKLLLSYLLALEKWDLVMTLELLGVDPL